MKTDYITGPMQQYEKWAEDSVVKYKPTHLKPYGIKRPDSINLMAGATGVFVILVAAAQLL